jgi:hypothetical protein
MVVSGQHRVPAALTPGGGGPNTLNRRLGGPQRRSVRLGQKSLTLPWNESRFRGFPVRRLGTIPAPTLHLFGGGGGGKMFQIKAVWIEENRRTDFDDLWLQNLTKKARGNCALRIKSLSAVTHLKPINHPSKSERKHLSEIWGSHSRKFTDVSKECCASIFRVKKSTLLGLPHPENGGITILQSIGNYLPVDTAWCPRRFEPAPSKRLHPPRDTYKMML